MIKVIKSKERHHRDLGWLSTYWHFSFDDYYDPANMNWGALRVFNDDIIQPGQGFGAHPHRDMEIVTYVLAWMESWNTKTTREIAGSSVPARSK